MDRVPSTVNLLMNVVMGIVLGVTGQLAMGGFSFPAFCQSFVLSMGVGYLLGTYIPVMKIGERLADLVGAKQGLMRYLVSTLAVAVIMILTITLFCMFVQTGRDVFLIYKKIIGLFLMVGIVAIEATLWLLKRIAIKLCSN